MGNPNPTNCRLTNNKISAVVDKYHYNIITENILGGGVNADNVVDKYLCLKRLTQNDIKRNDLSLSDKSTNRGLISEDRSTEATLLFTIPRSCLSRLHRIYL